MLMHRDVSLSQFSSFWATTPSQLSSICTFFCTKMQMQIQVLQVNLMSQIMHTHKGNNCKYMLSLKNAVYQTTLHTKVHKGRSLSELTWCVCVSVSGRASLHGKSSLQIERVRSDDQGWYECKVLMLEQQYDTFHNGSWVHLTVNGESWPST